jgi:hypothetical protein
VVGDITIRFPQLQDQPAQFDHVREVIMKANLLNKQTTIPDGADWQGYLVFKLDARTAAEVDKFLQDAGTLTVQLTNIGGDAAPASIEVPVGKATAPLAVSCPSDKPKSMTVCKPEPIGE